MAINWLEKRAKVFATIQRTGQLAKLKRGDVLRDCWAVEVTLNASERNALKNPTHRVFCLEVVSPPPAFDEALVWVQEGVSQTFRQEAPIAPYQPGGVVVYYEIQVAGPI